MGDTMFYKYETHLHTSESSSCGRSTAAEMVHAFIREGYSGFVVTDHFINSSSTVPKDLCWQDKMKLYARGYDNAKREAEKYSNFLVMFGWEYTLFPYCADYLTYNLDLEFLINHPEMLDISFPEYCKLVHDNGGVIVHAHPYRQAHYINYEPDLRQDLIDGIEVNNGLSTSSSNRNDKAWELARLNPHLFRTSGTDIHNVERAGIGGVAFKYRITDSKMFVEALKKGDGYLIIDGKITDREGNIIEE